jgi:membrane-associated protease RseP (regulator of RpoE activity)
VGTVGACVPAADADGECAPGDPQSAAALAGLVPGDVIVSVDGVAAGDWDAVRELIRASEGVPMSLVIDRDGATLAITVTPTAADVAVYDAAGVAQRKPDGSLLTERVGYLGMSPTQAVVRQDLGYGAGITLGYLGATAQLMFHLPEYVYHAGRTAFGLEERDPQGLISVVGVGRIAGDIASTEIDGYTMGDRLADMLGLVAILNLALFAFNMIPLLPLDGGHIASALWQGLKNAWARVRALPVPAPVDVARMMPLAYGVFALLMGMGLLLMYVDVVDPISL